VPSLDHLFEVGRIAVAKFLDRVDADTLEHLRMLRTNAFKLSQVVWHVRAVRPFLRLGIHWVSPLSNFLTTIVSLEPGGVHIIDTVSAAANGPLLVVCQANE
jgi:hypothetical protein